MVTGRPSLLIISVLLSISIKSSHCQRTYDTGDWIPIAATCPNCNQEDTQRSHIENKKATGRVLNVGPNDHPNQFFNNDQVVLQKAGQNYKTRQNSQLYKNDGKFYKNQPYVQNFDSQVQESNKRQHLLSQKALEPLFLNNELQPPKPVSIENIDQSNSLPLYQSDEENYQSAERFNPFANVNQYQVSTIADANPPIRFNLLQTNARPSQPDLQTASVLKPQQNINYKQPAVASQTFDQGRINNQYSPLSNQFLQQYNLSNPQRNNAAVNSENQVVSNQQSVEYQSAEYQTPNSQGNLYRQIEAGPTQNRISFPSKQPNEESLPNRYTNINPEAPRSSTGSNLNQDYIRNQNFQNSNTRELYNSPENIKTTLPNNNPSQNIPNKDFTDKLNYDKVESLYVPRELHNRQQQKITSSPESNNYSPYAVKQTSQESQEIKDNEQLQAKTSEQPFQRNQQIQGIENDFARQALESLKLQQQFQSGEVPISSSQSSKPSPKKKSHQPPLAVYMESDGQVDVKDVLQLLKNSGSISVQDEVGPETPQVFVGPYDLDAPEGYAKFELPYLSSLDSREIQFQSERFPFFVAPVNYKAPEGYSKIPLPSPHVGSIVVSETKNDKTSKTSQNSIAVETNKNIPERKQHYRDTLDQPNYQTRFLPANVQSQLPIRQTSDQYDIAQINAQYLNSNQRFPTPQSKFEEEYHRINNIYQTSPTPEISKFVITTQSPSLQPQQYIYNSKTGLIEPYSQPQNYIDKQRFIESNQDPVQPLRNSNQQISSQRQPSTQDITPEQPLSTITESNPPVRARPTPINRNEEDVPTTIRPRGRTRGNINQATTRGRGTTQYSDERGEIPSNERKNTQRNRGNVNQHTRTTTPQTNEESTESIQRYTPNIASTNTLSTERKPLSSSVPVYQTINENDKPTSPYVLTQTEKNEVNIENASLRPRIPYYDDVSDIRPFSQQSPFSQQNPNVAVLPNREEAKVHRFQNVNNLQQNLGIPIQTGGVTSIAPQDGDVGKVTTQYVKSTEEPVFEFTSRNKPPKTKPPVYDSYELDSALSDESSDFDDFFLHSSEEEAQSFSAPSNPALPGLINNLQDQSIRSILNPALIAPTTQHSAGDKIPETRFKTHKTQLNNQRNNPNDFSQRNYLSKSQTQQPQHEIYQLKPNNHQAEQSFEPQQTFSNQFGANQGQIIDETSGRTPAKTTVNYYAGTDPSNKQSTPSSMHPSASFSLNQQSLTKDIESSTHLPIIESTITSTTKRGRGRYRSRGTSTTSTTSSPPRRNVQRTRRPLKVESRSESLDNNKGASSTPKPFRTSDPPLNTNNYQTFDENGRNTNIKSNLGHEIQDNPYTDPAYISAIEKETLREQGSVLQQPRPEISRNSLPASYQPEISNPELNTYRESYPQTANNQYVTGPSGVIAEQSQTRTSNLQFVKEDDQTSRLIPSIQYKTENMEYGNNDGKIVQNQNLRIVSTPEANNEYSTKRTSSRNRSKPKNDAHSTKSVLQSQRISEIETPNEGEEFYGFFRTPSFNKEDTTVSSINSYSSLTPKTTEYSNMYKQSSLSTEMDQEQSLPQLNNQRQENLPVRPKYSSIIRQSLESESTTSTTTQEPEITKKTRIRGRTRKPYRNSSSRSRATERTETTRKYSTTERSSTGTTSSPRFRTRGRTQYRPPASLKEKREDDLASANYPAAFLASQGLTPKQSSTRSISSTENPKFQITVDSGSESNDQEHEDDQLVNPSYVNTRVVSPNGEISFSTPNHLDNTESEVSEKDETDIKTTAAFMEEDTAISNANDATISPLQKKKRGYWKLVKQRPISDPLETAESQNVGKLTVNSIMSTDEKQNSQKQSFHKVVETTDDDITDSTTLNSEDDKSVITTTEINSETETEPIKETTTTLTQQGLLDSVYELFGISEQELYQSDSETNKEVPFENGSTVNQTTVTPINSENVPYETSTHPLDIFDNDYEEAEISEDEQTEENHSVVVTSTTAPTKTTNSFERSMRTLQSTEISHETEICYRGKCVRTSNKPV